MHAFLGYLLVYVIAGFAVHSYMHESQRNGSYRDLKKPHWAPSIRNLGILLAIEFVFAAIAGARTDRDHNPAIFLALWLPLLANCGWLFYLFNRSEPRNAWYWGLAAAIFTIYQGCVYNRYDAVAGALMWFNVIVTIYIAAILFEMMRDNRRGKHGHGKKHGHE